LSAANCRNRACNTAAVAAAGIPDLDVARVRRWCEARVPTRIRSELRVEVDVEPRHLTILECRPPWRPDDPNREWTRFPIARLRYTKANRTWTIYWRDRNLKFHLYDRTGPSERIEDVLDEIDRDPTCIFWG
jgi:hypothetical protein